MGPGELVHACKKSKHHQTQRIRAGQKRVEEKQEEKLVISNPDAVIHPGTVVVHFYYAPLTYAAVVGSGGFECVAPATRSVVWFLYCRGGVGSVGGGGSG